jgi:glutamate synthase domain-containing protein 3
MKHASLTHSTYVEDLLADWSGLQRRLVKVMPREYKRVLAAEARRRAELRGSEMATLAVTGTAAEVAAEGATANR